MVKPSRSVSTDLLYFFCSFTHFSLTKLWQHSYSLFLQSAFSQQPASSLLFNSIPKKTDNNLQCILLQYKYPAKIFLSHTDFYFKHIYHLKANPMKSVFKKTAFAAVLVF